MSAWTTLGRCVVCGRTVRTLDDGMEFRFPRRVIVHAGECGQAFDARLDAAVAAVLRELEEMRESERKPG